MADGGHRHAYRRLDSHDITRFEGVDYTYNLFTGVDVPYCGRMLGYMQAPGFYLMEKQLT